MPRYQKEYCDFGFNFLLLGDGNVGKSSVMQRFTDNHYDAAVLPGPRGIECKHIRAGCAEVRLAIYDTSGHPRFRSLYRRYYKNAVGILLFYSIDDRESFENISSWLDDVRKYGYNDSVVTLVGSKSDKYTSREVSNEEGKLFAEVNKIHFFEVSAKSGENVYEAFSFTTSSVFMKLLDEDMDYSRVQILGTCDGFSPVSYLCGLR